MNPQENQARELPKLERCGACGQWNADPRLYTQEEQDAAELFHCGCEETEPYQPTPTEMYEAGIISESEYRNL